MKEICNKMKEILINNESKLKEYLLKNFKFEVYFTGSTPLAYLFPHIGCELTEDVKINDKIINSGSLIFYSNNGTEMEIYKVGDYRYFYIVKDYNEFIKEHTKYQKTLPWNNPPVPLIHPITKQYFEL